MYLQNSEIFRKCYLPLFFRDVSGIPKEVRNLEMSEQLKHYYEFGAFRLYPEEHLLLHGDERLRLRPKIFDLLVVLVRQQGELLTKEDLLQKVWSGTAVEEGNLNRNISTLRHILGETTDEGCFIETIPKVGYRFVADVQEIHSESNGKAAVLDREDSSTARLKDEIIEITKPGQSEAPAPNSRVNQVSLWRRTIRFVLPALVLVVIASVYFFTTKGPQSGGASSISESPQVIRPGLVRLTSSLASDNYPSWSPDGKQLTFSSNRDNKQQIYVMNSDGGGIRNLMNQSAGGFLPAWSPDGKRLAFISDRDGNEEIYVMNIDGTAETRLTFTKEREGSPRWSPDSSRIVFARNHFDNAYNFDLFVINADGTGEVQLTADTEYDAEPLFSPDGKQIAFVSGRNHSFEVYVMNADGLNQVNLTRDPRADGPLGWSADAKYMFFSSDRNNPSEAYQVWRMNADGTFPVQLSFVDFRMSRPCLSPDGKRVAFMAKENDNADIYVLDLAIPD